MHTEYESTPVELDELINPEQLYLREIGEIPLLTAEEEVTVLRNVVAARKAQKELDEGSIPPERRGELEILIEMGKNSRETLIKANTRLVVSIAKRYLPSTTIPFLDLVQEGNLGLMKAANKHDGRPVKFSTYATGWIKQFISRGIQNKERAIRVPNRFRAEIKQLLDLEEAFREKLGREPSLEEIATGLGVTVEKARRLNQAKSPPLSLDAPVDEEEDNRENVGFLGDSGPSMEELMMSKLERQRIAEQLSSLAVDDVRVLRLAFGFEDGDSHRSSAEIAQIMGWSGKEGAQRVREIRNRTMKSLRHPLKLGHYVDANDKEK